VALRPTGPTQGRTLGLDVRPLTPDIARQLNLRSLEGVVVARVEDESAAAEAGIQRGDVIREVNRQRVRTLQDFERATKDLKEGDRVTVLLQRGPQALYVAFTVARG
jgi:serine protease Do